MGPITYINLSDDQMKSIHTLSEKAYVHSQQLICAHAVKNIKLVGKYSRLSFRSQRAYAEFVIEIIRKNCCFRGKTPPCNHEMDEAGRRIVLSWCPEHVSDEE